MLERNTCVAQLSVARFFFGINMPDDVVWQADDLVSGPLSHFGEAFCFGLIFEGVAGEVDTYHQTSVCTLSVAREGVFT